MGDGVAGRNKANRVFIPVRITDHQQSAIAIRSHGQEPLFLMIAIVNRDCVRIVEHGIDIDEIDLMLSSIGLVLGRIEAYLQHLPPDRAENLCSYQTPRSLLVEAQLRWAIRRLHTRTHRSYAEP